MQLRRLQPHELSLHRALRLAALRDSPDSFSDALADIEAQPASYWEQLTRSVTEPKRHVMFLACDGERAIGSVYGLSGGGLGGAGRVGGMWVEPVWRGRGVAAALLHEVIDWARARGLGGLSLWAPAHAPAAIALYHRAGFRETGTEGPLASRPACRIVEMALSL